MSEIEKANVEMRKRKLDTIERVFTPCYRGKLSLTLRIETPLYCRISRKLRDKSRP